jgi:hypothetical protein
MMRSLTRPRLTRAQLVIVAVLSAAATALIIVVASGRTPAQSAVLAALRHRQVVVSAGGGSGTGAGSSDPAIDAGIAPAAAATAQQTSSDGSSTATDSGSGSTSDTTNTTTTTTTPSNTPTTPRAQHVFVVALSTTSYDAAFGPGSSARYLNGTLKRQGTFLGGYESLGADGLPDYLAMIGGQPPNPDTEAGCAAYAEFPTTATSDKAGIVSAAGCVYPNTVLTIGDQVTSSGGQWKAYVAGIGSQACPHPDSNAIDSTPPPHSGATYDTRHNPFIYYHSLLDLGGCASDDVSITQLSRDLSKASSTPTYSYIAPDACGEATAVSCPGGGAAGLPAEDAFLKQWVPRITASPAYKQGGALLIVFAPPIGTPGTTPTSNQSVPTGVLVLSPKTPHDQIVSTVYNPYSVLRVTDELLGYKPLGLAAKAKSFVSKTFSGP